jgi:succinate dehydrogenase/fumarate reductase flavoprotein subunit
MRRETVTVDGVEVPVWLVDTVVVGAGAAGMNCAVQLVHQWRAKGVADPAERLLVVTGGLALGASRMSGSDKQTYYKMGTSPRIPDTAEDFAKTLTSFGCCHGDLALIEGIGSLRGFHHLVELGVPFPHDRLGAFIGYKTDHDPYERATSAGPKTSRFMSECLQAEAEREGVRIVDAQPVLQFLTRGEGPERRIIGMVCFDLPHQGDDEPALSLFIARNWVLAAGGAGEIYETTVYPRGQYGIHGAAFEAGLEACNLTESQFGLASTAFRWNVSGTYMQAIPRIYSTDAEGGDPREFLTEYHDDMSSLATNIFLKGYQWPFDAQRIVERQSSLIDMAVHQETVVRGRRVWMDFLRNPVGATDWEGFRLEALKSEAREYLLRTGATQSTPIERLAHMNVPAIDIYAENGIDLRKEPLEIAVCAQHMNGGFAVGPWWESSVPRTFVIGEMAGTHGVKRPGGSALNAGQVGALRAAQSIVQVWGDEAASEPTCPEEATHGLGQVLERLRGILTTNAGTTPADALDEIRLRMTRYGAHLRSAETARRALEEGRLQFRRLASGALAVRSPRQLPSALRALQQCLTHVAILRAICGMLDRGAGSRGSHCVLADDGIEMHPALLDPDSGCPYRFREENEALRQRILLVKYREGEEAEGPLFDVREETPRPVPRIDAAFEPAWLDYREGRVFGA